MSNVADVKLNEQPGMLDKPAQELYEIELVGGQTVQKGNPTTPPAF